MNASAAILQTKPSRKSPYSGRANSPGDHAQVPDRVTAHHLSNHVAICAHSRESPGVDNINRVRWVSHVKKPLVGADVVAIYGAREFIELLVVEVGEYRNIPQRGSLVSYILLGPFSGHEVWLRA